MLGSVPSNDCNRAHRRTAQALRTGSASGTANDESASPTESANENPTEFSDFKGALKLRSPTHSPRSSRLPERSRLHPRHHIHQLEPRPRHRAPAHVIFARKIGGTVSPIAVNSSPRQFCDPGEILNRDELTVVATRSFDGHCAARHVVADTKAILIFRVAGAAIVGPAIAARPALTMRNIDQSPMARGG
jgi:transposase